MCSHHFESFLVISETEVCSTCPITGKESHEPVIRNLLYQAGKSKVAEISTHCRGQVTPAGLFNCRELYKKAHFSLKSTLAELFVHTLSSVRIHMAQAASPHCLIYSPTCQELYSACKLQPSPPMDLSELTHEMSRGEIQ